MIKKEALASFFGEKLIFQNHGNSRMKKILFLPLRSGQGLIPLEIQSKKPLQKHGMDVFSRPIDVIRDRFIAISLLYRKSFYHSLFDLLDKRIDERKRQE